MNREVEQREDLWVFRYSIPHPDYKKPYLDFGYYVYTSEEEAQDHFAEVFKYYFSDYYGDCTGVNISEYSSEDISLLYLEDVKALDSYLEDDSYNNFKMVIENLPLHERTLLRSNRQKSAYSDSLSKRL